MAKEKAPRRRTAGSRTTSRKAARKTGTAKKTTTRKKAAPRKKSATRKQSSKNTDARTATNRPSPKKKVARKTASPARAKRAAPSGARAPRRALGAAKPAAAALARRKLTAAQRRNFRETLLDLRERLSSQISVLKNDSLQRPDEVNPLEDGTDAFDRQMALKLASAEQESLGEIDDALRRIEGGSYGVCEQCGDLIEGPRLRALPFVRNCIGCQSELEGDGNGLRRAMVLMSGTP